MIYKYCWGKFFVLLNIPSCGKIIDQFQNCKFFQICIEYVSKTKSFSFLPESWGPAGRTDFRRIQNFKREDTREGGTIWWCGIFGAPPLYPPLLLSSSFSVCTFLFSAHRYKSFVASKLDVTSSHSKSSNLTNGSPPLHARLAAANGKAGKWCQTPALPS